MVFGGNQLEGFFPRQLAFTMRMVGTVLVVGDIPQVCRFYFVSSFDIKFISEGTFSSLLHRLSMSIWPFRLRQEASRQLLNRVYSPP